jgi:cytochrome c-type biogenesis protein CcmE
MHKRTKNRLIILLLSLTLIATGVYIILYNLQENIVFFYPPSKLHEITTDKEIRVGGLVKPGSIKKIRDDEISFTITDMVSEVQINYKGILPALFRENQGIVARGHLIDGQFKAIELLTKHDESYMPPEIAKSLK